MISTRDPKPARSPAAEPSPKDADSRKNPRRVGARPRLLVFVIAYHAETTLKRVLERIPASIFEDLDSEILVVDDASADRTYEIGCEYRDTHPSVAVTVLRNEYNQGYGGNQKVGYAYAIAQGFDYVAMVHGDGQYAPEELPRLVQPLLAGEADAVFGSRMLRRFDALKGGMPLYKYIGNKVLTTAQNTLLGSNLSEFHSGYRLYSVAALKQLPITLNSNDFHFDTEIIIQLLNARMRISELPIPTFYGDEVCRVDGMKYAGDVMRATVLNSLHRVGLMYQRRFDTAPEQTYELKVGYPSSHTYALDSVPAGSSVIEIGAGPEGLAGEFVKKGCQVTVVDKAAPPEPSSSGIAVVEQDLNEPPTYDPKADYLLLLDVIEKVESPERFLADLRKKFDFQPRELVLTTPNVAFFVQRLMLLLGQFNYGKRGVLDRTHTRLFTFRSTEQLLLDAGFRIEEVRGVPVPFPKVLGNGVVGRLAVQGNLALIKLSKTLFSYQIFVRAKSTPDIEFILAQARRSEQPARV